MRKSGHEKLTSSHSVDDFHVERETGIFAYVSKADLFFAIKIASVIELALMAIMQF